MAASVTCLPVSPRAKIDNAIVTVAGQPENDTDGSQIKCYVKAAAPAGSTPALDLRSEVFATSAAGGHAVPPWIFPVAGAWTVTLRKAADDSQLATLSLTVA